ncbi:MAG: hypothetical protein P8M30_20880 [Planctomycetaceae bacterium]|jgi:hypothetical protein|nr:hypothetical protein [Planctomycetaceae bacterium]MDB4786682.1 hypothetical protein [Planctomycetaceae bacterium]MDC0273136.1 hypothetical protein [Planctomycetaceae bacterium]MDG2391768.1 hypothetical protein [Planctomycetaceae bacterium]
MDFETRLQRAIQRGQQTRDQRGQAAIDKQMTEEEYRQLHSSIRLELSEHIEKGVRQVSDHFPGFRYQTVVGEDGWGARIVRDDFAINDGKKSNLYSRLELLIRPFSETRIIELTTKGTIRNKEIISRNHFQFLDEIDIDTFSELIDVWILEYAEAYSADA